MDPIEHHDANKEWTVKKTLTIVLAATVLFVLTAGGPAQAHTRTASTKLTISVSDSTPDQGEKVTFSGQLKSKWKACKKNQKVHLYRGQKRVETTTTSSSGGYSFDKRIRSNSNWTVKYEGRRFGKHPHVHRCKPSKSETIRIRV